MVTASAWLRPAISAGAAEPGQNGVAPGAGAGDFEERLLGLLPLALAGHLDGGLEARPGGFLGRLLLRLRIAPGARCDDDQDGEADDPVLVSFPELYRLVAAVFFLDLANEVSHVVP